MEYRAQAKGRCQRHFIQKRPRDDRNFRQHSEHWLAEWLSGVGSENPFAKQGLHLVDVSVDWRVLSNSGMDEGFIRPAISAGGWPLIPGSSIKGLFRRACSPEQRELWCGNRWGAEQQQPGLLRFHGAWPVDDSWRKGLLDVVHPQQNWQVGYSPDQSDGCHSAYALVSLLKPHLQIGISSTGRELSEQEWDDVDATLQRALASGIGGRTSTGYGRSQALGEPVLFSCVLGGQGSAPKLFDGTPEFRPIMFRSAIRGMALRLFGGVTSEARARKAVDQIFGGLGAGEAAQLGLLEMAYTHSMLQLDGPVFRTSGLLQWRVQRAFAAGESEETLRKLLAALHGLTMALAGFGRTWRRPDHRIFKPRYTRTQIGCHWQWLDSGALPEGIQVQSGRVLERLLREARGLARQWLGIHGSTPFVLPPWREVMAPERMMVWVREASSAADAKVIHWFHEPPLKRSDLTGRLRNKQIDDLPTRVGRIWNRLLPLDGGPQAPAQGSLASAMARPVRRSAPNTSAPHASRSQAVYEPHRGRFMESVVLFPIFSSDGRLSNESHDFVNRLETTGFIQVDWSDPSE
jgi:CRISPR-associated protein Cmr6